MHTVGIQHVHSATRNFAGTCSFPPPKGNKGYKKSGVLLLSDFDNICRVDVIFPFAWRDYISVDTFQMHSAPKNKLSNETEKRMDLPLHVTVIYAYNFNYLAAPSFEIVFRCFIVTWGFYLTARGVFSKINTNSIYYSR